MSKHLLLHGNGIRAKLHAPKMKQNKNMTARCHTVETHLLGVGRRVADADEDAGEAQAGDDCLVHLSQGHVHPQGPAACAGELHHLHHMQHGTISAFCVALRNPSVFGLHSSVTSVSSSM